MKKKILSIFLVISLLMMNCVNVFAATSSEIKIYINGVIVDTKDASNYIDTNGRTMVPIRFVSEDAGYVVVYDSKTKEAILHEGGCSCKDDNYNKEHDLVKIKTNSKTLVTKDGTVQMDTVAVNKNGRLYVPLRFVTEGLGFEVGYKQESSNNKIIHNVYLTKKVETPPTQNPTEVTFDTTKKISYDENVGGEVYRVKHDDERLKGIDPDGNNVFNPGFILIYPGLSLYNDDWRYDTSKTPEEHLQKFKDITISLNCNYRINGKWSRDDTDNEQGNGSVALGEDLYKGYYEIIIGSWRSPSQVGVVYENNIDMNLFLIALKYFGNNDDLGERFWSMIDSAYALNDFDPSKFGITLTETGRTEFGAKSYYVKFTNSDQQWILQDSPAGYTGVKVFIPIQ